MKHALIIFCLVSSGCTTIQKMSPETEAKMLEEYKLKIEYEAYLSQQVAIERAKQTAAPEPVTGPHPAQLVEHVCNSTPIYDVYGNFVRTSVKCW